MDGSAGEIYVAPDGKPIYKVPSEFQFDEKKSYDITIRNLTYKIVTKTKEGETVKVLLNNVTASANAGELLGVVGPSGAGKSTFLDAVAGRINPLSLEGLVLVNRKPIQHDFKRLSGYVMQDDQLYPMLTVRETLMFSARLRLPSTMTGEQKAERVELMIKQLGLSNCAGTRIGSDEVRGVSGGERRRVSIGVDLIHDPPVLFLDEPTSGLDSTSALKVVSILNDIAETRKRTIVLTIHQPSFRQLEKIHKLVVLGKGNVVYHGAYPDMYDHFTRFGSTIPEQVNMLEFALDLIEEYQSKEGGLQPLIEFESNRSSEGERTLGHTASNISAVAEPVKFANAFGTELGVLMDRNAKNIVRTNELLVNRLFLVAFMGLTMGSLFFDVNQDMTGVRDRGSYFAFTLAFIIFTAVEALPLFIKERQIFIRETSRGAYRSSSYSFANLLVFLPFYFAQALLYSIVAYFMVGLVKTAGAFFFSVLVLFLTITLANAFVFFWSSFIPSFIIGNTIVTALNSFMFLFSGFFLPKNKIPRYWIWFNYLSNFKWPLDALFKNEYNALTTVCFQEVSDGTCVTTGEDVLSTSGAETYNKWVDVVVMIGFISFYRLLFYLGLRIQSRSVRN